MDRIQSMRVFLEVAKLKSFTKASEQLGLPKASVSSYVQDLEDHLGARLLQRTTRTVQLTYDGQIFLERCQDLLSDIDEVETIFKQQNELISGRIRVDMSIAMALHSVLPNLNEFLELYPNIEVELSCSDRRVDLIREGFDCVIRVGNLKDSDLIVRPIANYKVVNCVSPGYIKKYGKPKNLKDLSRHQLIHFTSTFGAKAEGFEYIETGKVKTLQMPGKLTVNNAAAYQSACLNGLGIIQVPYVGVRELIKSGQLVEVLPKFLAEPMPVSILYPHRRSLPARLRVFIDWVSSNVLT